jgi:Flp pilus assembly protein TadD
MDPTSGGLADCDRALAINPRCAAAYVCRGLAHLQMHREEEAERDFAAALALDPSLKHQIEGVSGRVR